MNNPHNPEFITKRPWYLGEGTDAAAAAAVNDAVLLDAASLQHQASQRPDAERQQRELTSLTAAEDRLAAQRKQLRRQHHSHQAWEVGQWVEALKKRNKLPYQMCQIVQIYNISSNSDVNRHRGTSFLFDLKFEDGSIEKKVKLESGSKPRIRWTGAGNRAISDFHTADTASTNATAAVASTYTSKRDQYHGYDRDKHNAMVGQKFEQKLALRRELRQKRAQNQPADDDETKKSNINDNKKNSNKNTGSDSDSDWNDSDVEGSDNNRDNDDSDDEDFVQQDADDRVMTTRLARQGGVGGAQMKVTARNLRIREDTAKYLRNLDVHSAYYDPKSRSMRDHPHPDQHFADTTMEADFAGDNFARISGDAVALAQQQLFAWENNGSGADMNDNDQKTSHDGTGTNSSLHAVHPQANPSQAEMMHKQLKSKALDAKREAQRAVLEKYGGAEYLDGKGGLAKAVGESSPIAPAATSSSSLPASNRSLRFGVSTASEQQYNRDGTRVATTNDSKASNNKRSIAPLISKYEENIFRNGHTTVWGSFFHKGAWMWGYADDHSLMKQSYCTGIPGRAANDDAHEMTYGTGRAGSAALAQARALLPATTGASSAKSRSVANAQSDLYEQTVNPNVLDDRKVKEALARQQGEGGIDNNRKRQKYNSMHADFDMTPEIMEAYRLGKETTRDPMAALGDNELLEYK